jgi:hypothetical protein
MTKLDMELTGVGLGSAQMRMSMTIGPRITAFAYACNTYGARAVASHRSIAFLRPGWVKDAKQGGLIMTRCNEQLGSTCRAQRLLCAG